MKLLRRGLALVAVFLVGLLAAPVAAGARTGVNPVTGRCPEPGTGRVVQCLHVVRHGEWLWSIARDNLRADFGMAHPRPHDVRTRAGEIHHLNRALVGEDPHRLRPGKELRLYPWVGGGQAPPPAPGVATNGRPGRYADAQAVDLDAAGRAVTAGMLSGQFAVARFTDDGPDPSFGDGGLALTPVGTFAWAREVAVQPDGRILAAGFAGRTQGELASDVAVVRHLPDGAPDPAWGGDGTVTVPFADEYASGTAMALEPDGAVVVVGSVGEDVLVLRLLPTGALDPSFGTGGSVRADVAGGVDVARDVVRRPDGGLVVVGTAAPAPASGESDAFVLQLTADGRPGPARVVDYGTPFDAAAAVALAPDGSLLVTGSRVEERIVQQVVLALHAADGSLLGTTVTAAGDWSDGDDVAVTPDGTVVVVGRGGREAVLLRYDLAGSLLEQRLLDFGGERNAAFGVRIAGDGRAVVAGCTCDGANTAQRGGFEIPSSIVVARVDV